MRKIEWRKFIFLLCSFNGFRIVSNEKQIIYANILVKDWCSCFASFSSKYELRTNNIRPFPILRNIYLRNLKEFLAQRAVMHFPFILHGLFIREFSKKTHHALLFCCWTELGEKILRRKLILRLENKSLMDQLEIAFNFISWQQGKRKTWHDRAEIFSSCFGNIRDMKRFRYYQILLLFNPYPS